MKKQSVEALESFDHHGPHKRFSRFQVSDPVARELERAGLVRILGTPDPSLAAGGKSSASQAAPASQQTTVKPSKRGRKPRHSGPLS